VYYGQRTCVERTDAEDDTDDFKVAGDAQAGRRCGRGGSGAVLCGNDEKISMRRIELKSADTSGIGDIINIHNSAVHEIAGSWYPEEIIENWAMPKTPEKIKQLREAIQDGEEIFIVGRTNNRTVGFGVIVPKRNELRAVYVHPSFGRQGIGTQILVRLEQIAIEQGARSLELDASLNAEEFYAKNGFAAIERGVHELRSGHKMQCVRMRKTLIAD
jgi:putative acetyltransferase